jgi:fused signal recognition particle receptor
MFSFFKKKPVAPEVPELKPLAPAPTPSLETAPAAAVEPLLPIEEPAQKLSWMTRLKAGLSKTSNNLSLLFVGARIDEDLYEELESALLMSDAGMDATQYLLDSLRRKVKEDKLLDAAAVKAALKTLLVDMLRRWKSRSNWAATSRW